MIPEHISQALTHATETLHTCVPEQREAIMTWINSLLDQVQR